MSRSPRLKIWVRAAAAGMLMALSLFLLPPPLNLVFVLIGLIFLLAQGAALLKTRPQAYDLAQLKSLHERELARDDPEEPDEAAEGIERDWVYCHRCGGSLPASHAICPECGGPLGV